MDLRFSCSRLSEQLELPVFTREMRALMRGRRVLVLLLICIAVAVAVAAILLKLFAMDVFISQKLDRQSITGYLSSGDEPLTRIWMSLFSTMVYLEALLIMLFAPLMTAGAITREQDQQTWETLLLSPLSSHNILLGKLCASLSVIVLQMICIISGIAIVVAFFLGGISLVQVLWAIGLLLSSAVFFGMLGLYFSTLFRRTIPAVLMAYLCSFVLVIALPFLNNLAVQRYPQSFVAPGEVIIKSVVMLILLITVTIGMLWLLLNQQPVVRRIREIAFILVSLAGIYLIVFVPHLDLQFLFASTGISTIYAVPLVSIFTLVYERFTRLRASFYTWLGLWVIVVLCLGVIFANWLNPFSIFDEEIRLIWPVADLYFCPLTIIGNPLSTLFYLLVVQVDNINASPYYLLATIALLCFASLLLKALAARELDIQRKSFEGPWFDRMIRTKYGDDRAV